MVTLRPYQQDAVDQIRAAFAAGKRAPLYVAPTGSGKTVIFTYITHNGAALGTRIGIVMHRIELLGQTSAELANFGVPHGVINPAWPRTRHNIQVATIQTLTRRTGYEFDLLIFDEAHHATNETTRAILKQYPNACILGVTATPCRMSGRGLGTVFDAMLLGPSVRWLIDNDYLARPRVYAPSNIDTGSLRSARGDYEHAAVEALMNRREITGCVVEHYRRLVNGYPAVAFCASVKHAEDVAESFQEAGFRAASIDGTLDKAVRRDRIKALADGRLNVLASCDLISEGVDVPVIAAAILLRPTKSLAIYLQQVGRALRPYPGKECAYILDHVGNVFRHGLPDMDRKWSLDTGVVLDREGEAVPMTRQCPNCFYVHLMARECPDCHFVYPPAEREAPKETAGDLEEISEQDVETLLAAARTSGKLKDFHKWAKAAGRGPGSAWHAFKRRGGSRKLEGMKIR